MVPSRALNIMIRHCSKVFNFHSAQCQHFRRMSQCHDSCSEHTHYEEIILKQNSLRGRLTTCFGLIWWKWTKTDKSGQNLIKVQLISHDGERPTLACCQTTLFKISHSTFRGFTYFACLHKPQKKVFQGSWKIKSAPRQQYSRLDSSFVSLFSEDEECLLWVKRGHLLSEKKLFWVFSVLVKFLFKCIFYGGFPQEELII